MTILYVLAALGVGLAIGYSAGVVVEGGRCQRQIDFLKRKLKQSGRVY